MSSFVFIAGGIGITPTMSMLREMSLAGRKEKSLLIYANKTHSDIVFKKEIDRLSKKHKWLKVVYVLSSEERKGYVFGKADSKLLTKHIKDFSAHHIFLVGPEPMIRSVKRNLIKLGADKRKIYTEIFKLK